MDIVVLGFAIMELAQNVIPVDIAPEETERISFLDMKIPMIVGQEKIRVKNNQPGRGTGIGQSPKKSRPWGINPKTSLALPILKGEK